MCSVAPSNAATVDYSAARGEKSAAIEVNFADPTVRARYARSCGRCALSDGCTGSVTSGAYYADDQMHLMPRMRPEDETAALMPFTDAMLAIAVKDVNAAYASQQLTPALEAEPLF